MSDWSLPKEEIIEAKAFIDMFEVAPAFLVETAELAWMRIGEGCAVSLPAAPAMGLNRILAVRDRDDLERAYQWLSGRKGKRYVQIDEASAPAEILQWLKERGMEKQGNGWAKLTLPASSVTLLPAGIVTTRLAGPGDAALFAETMCRGFGFDRGLEPFWAGIVGKPRWNCFIAWLDDIPVATGAMYMDDGYAWLGGGATIAEYRNRGAQAALINARLEAGLSQGVSVFSVETEQPEQGRERGSTSYSNLRKAGFRQVYTRQNFRLED